ncbi:hypothetical protein KAR10_03115 [bacterium]|nr:hypothetical protein [bacterium]
MKHLKLPSFRIVVDNIPLKTAKLEKILTEGQRRVASYLDVRYPDSQDIIFLLGGKAVKAGRFYPSGREILTVGEALEKLRIQKEGVIGFHEISKLVMIVIMGTFMFEPTHSGLKTKQINFNSLLSLFIRKRFTGYLEFKMKNTLNYLTFYGGQTGKGYFAYEVSPEQMEFPVKLMSEMVENADEDGEINVYESIGEGDLHGHGAQTDPVIPPDELPDEQEKAKFTSEILDLCLVAIYEDLFRIMFKICAKHMETREIEAVFQGAFNQAALKYPDIFRGVEEREDGTRISGGLINFERLLKAKNYLPVPQREQGFLKGINELAFLRINAMQNILPPQLFKQGLREMMDKIASSKKAYQGNFTIIKFIYEFSRILEKVYPGKVDG